MSPQEKYRKLLMQQKNEIEYNMIISNYYYQKMIMSITKFLADIIFYKIDEFCLYDKGKEKEFLGIQTMMYNTYWFKYTKLTYNQRKTLKRDAIEKLKHEYNYDIAHFHIDGFEVEIIIRVSKVCLDN